MNDQRVAVQHAVKTLEANGKVVSAYNVNQVLRSTPPYYGMSYRDLLPLLRNQQDMPNDPRYQQVIWMAEALEEVLAQRRHGHLQALIEQGSTTWSRCAPAMHQASARGDPMVQVEAWVASFERLRFGREAAIVRVYGRQYG
jgi:hypothetical protein